MVMCVDVLVRAADDWSITFNGLVTCRATGFEYYSVSIMVNRVAFSRGLVLCSILSALCDSKKRLRWFEKGMEDMSYQEYWKIPLVTMAAIVNDENRVLTLSLRYLLTNAFVHELRM